MVESVPAHPRTSPPDPRSLTLSWLLEQLLADKLIARAMAQKVVEPPVGKEGSRPHPVVIAAAQEWPDPRRPGHKLTLEALTQWLAQRARLGYARVDPLKLDMAAITEVVAYAYAARCGILPIKSTPNGVVLAVKDPFDVHWMRDLELSLKVPITRVVANPLDIDRYLVEFYAIARSVRLTGEDRARFAPAELRNLEQLTELSRAGKLTAEDQHVVAIVDWLLQYAFDSRASDIHLEPRRDTGNVRFRIDGVLHDVSTAPRSIAPAVTTRLKVMADMNIAEHRVPQDGRISLNVGAKGIDLRMATLPTIYGEKIVMRVLDKSSVVLGFADLGFDDDLLQTYERLYTKPYGTILVTGPTGSGKSTTLYTTLSALNTPEKNIITVEDPVELPLKGVNQVQLNVKAGLDFAAALRSILRSDPDIVLVGEIRDKETAVISIEAALTGHMVLSTLHTNSAASTPMRLIEMGLEPFLVTSAVSGVLAQRLARRLCVHCKEAFEPTEADIVSAGWTMEEVQVIGGMDKLHRAVGCSACSNTGYRGRKALAELLPMTEEIERIIIEGGSVEEIHRTGVVQGMCTLRQSGLRKAIEGETTLEEVLRVVA